MRFLPILAAASGLVAGSFAVAQAVAQGTTPALRLSLSIEAQPLRTALRAFESQTGLQVSYREEDVATAGVMAPKVVGELEPEEALRLLLSGTGLTFEFINPRLVRVSSATESAPEPKMAEGEKPTAMAGTGTGRQIRLAQADRNRSDAGDLEAEPVAANRLSSSAAVPEVLIEGSRILNADIRRSRDDAQPYVVFDRSHIERSQATSLEDFFKTRLPMNTIQGTNSQSTGNFGSQSSIDLRGLGTNQTLILVDGRRLPSVFTSSAVPAGNFNQPDINGIPLAAVERIEVLPSTASGIYGGGATGGVINIILRRDYTGFEIRAEYGDSFESGGSARRLDANGGFSLFQGRTRVQVAASYSDSDPLLVGDRDLTAQARQLQLSNNPDAFFGSTVPLGYTPNIRSVNGTNLVLKPEFGGAELNSPRTHVPVGYTGPASDDGAALVANAGKYNLDLPADVQGARQSLLNNPTTNSASVHVRHEFTSRLEAFLDLSTLENQGEVFSANVPNSVTLQPSAPNNPFTTAINVRFPSPGLEFVRTTDSETRRAAGGVIVRLPRNWTFATDYSWSRARYRSAATNPSVHANASTALGSGALDVLRDLNAFPIDYSPYLLPSPTFVLGPADAILRDATVRVAGPTFELPGGPLAVSGLYEHREEEALNSFREATNANGTHTITFFPSRSQSVESYYLETRAPLISTKNSMRGVRLLELQASVRRDEYKTTSGPALAGITVPSREAPLSEVTRSRNDVHSDDYTLGLRYSPLSDLILRASYGTGFLPPSIAQIAATTVPGFNVTVVDPKRGNVSTTYTGVTVTSGGNPDLQPEESESWSFGLVLTPRFVPDLRLSLDYTHIRKSREITTLVGFQPVIDNEDLFPGRVTRDEKRPGDPAEWAGPIIALDVSPINVATTTVDAYDIQADYAVRSERLGTFNFFAVATWQPHLKRQLLPALPVIDSVGFEGGPLEWRASAGLSWTRGAWIAGWNTQYFNSYYVYTSDASDGTRTSQTLSQGSATVPHQIYHDVFARYRFGESAVLGVGPLVNLEITLGIRNVFNEDPPILATTGSTGGYSRYGDPRLRTYMLAAKLAF